MTFSASPLTPGTDAGDDAWRRTADAVVEAVTQAAAQIPSAAPLAVQAAAPDGAGLTLPTGTALVAYLGAGAEGKVLLVLAAELVQALADTPFGAVEPADALRPALDTLAAALGGRLDGTPTAIAVEDCLDVLAGGTTVLVPLVAGDTVHALVGVSLAAPAPAGPTAAGAAASWGLDMLRDVEMEVTCELGRTRMTVRQLLALAPGDVVELDRLAGSPADLLVNGTLLARGEVVVVDEAFGLRITEIVTRDAR
ncbi:MAG TPA: flagellar motor switch protein FliN [Kineosporiaceae bacterium]|nr:flagellar motor switch protein FliN [Kineosporiaceae bacterium]